jgi:hypothetical protein
MRLRSVVTYCRIAGALVLSVPAFAQEFSAQGITHAGAGTITAKVFASGGKVRIEANDQPGTPAADSGAYTILDVAKQTSVVVSPGRKTVIQQSPAQARTNLAQYGGDPCARNPGASATSTCAKTGTETIGGRTADKYELKTSVRGQSLTVNVWIDTRLRIVLKSDMQGSLTYELQNVQEGPQPASLFEMPAGYQKVP